MLLRFNMTCLVLKVKCVAFIVCIWEHSKESCCIVSYRERLLAVYFDTRNMFKLMYMPEMHYKMLMSNNDWKCIFGSKIFCIKLIFFLSIGVYKFYVSCIGLRKKIMGYISTYINC